MFRYRALDADGVIRTGRLSATSEVEAVRELLRQGLQPVSVSQDGLSAEFRTVRRIKAPGLAEQLVLVRELSTLLGAGISLSEVLPSLVVAYANQALGSALSRTDRAVRSGLKLSEALRGSGLTLPPYVLALIEAGEASGALAEALADAATQMEHEQRIGQELRNALIYPAVLVSSGVLAVMVIFVGVVPRFASLLKSSRAEVPALSRWIIEAGLFVKQNLFAFGLGAAVSMLLAAMILSQAGVRQSILEALSRLPLIGSWLLRVDIGRWATVLGTLLSNRVPIIVAINLSAGALRLKRLRDDLLHTGRELERGRSLSDVLGAKGWFPPARLNLIRVGERSGELPRMLNTLGVMETDAARLIQRRVLALIEPIAILLIGAVIGVIMVAVMMAITSLNTAVV